MPAAVFSENETKRPKKRPKREGLPSTPVIEKAMELLECSGAQAKVCEIYTVASFMQIYAKSVSQICMALSLHDK